MAQRLRPDRSHRDLGYSPRDDDRGRYAAGLPHEPEETFDRENFGGVDARGRSTDFESRSGGPVYGVSGASSSQAYWRAAPRRQQMPRINHRGHGPKGYRRTDERLREAICERLLEDPDIDAREITVEVADGVVTLEGRVENRLSKHIIEDLVDDCSGVTGIRNLIAVHAAAAAAPA